MVGDTVFLDRNGDKAPFTPDNILGIAHSRFQDDTGLELHALGELEFFLLRDGKDEYYEPDKQTGYSPDRNSWGTMVAAQNVLYQARAAGASAEEIARAERCDALHPGYGFLSENADFCQAVMDAGITFIGPPPAIMRRLGNKVEARALAIESDVPVMPATEPLPHDGAEITRLASDKSLRTCTR